MRTQEARRRKQDEGRRTTEEGTEGGASFSKFHSTNSVHPSAAIASSKELELTTFSAGDQTLSLPKRTWKGEHVYAPSGCMRKGGRKVYASANFKTVSLVGCWGVWKSFSTARYNAREPGYRKWTRNRHYVRRWENRGCLCRVFVEETTNNNSKHSTRSNQAPRATHCLGGIVSTHHTVQPPWWCAAEDWRTKAKGVRMCHFQIE